MGPAAHACSGQHLGARGADEHATAEARRIGEESGQLPLVLEQVSAYYKQKVTALAQRITAMIEPCIILGMGVAVAVILTAIYLPMFSMGGAVH